MPKLGLPFHKKHGGDGAHNNGVDTRRRDPAPRGGMKSHLLAFLPEFVGTVLFLWFAYAIHQMAIDDRTGVLAQDGVGSLSSAQTVVIVALGYGFSYLVMVWALYRVTDGFFNPAVTVGLCLAGALSPIRGAILFIAQLLGGMAAAGLVECMFPGSITVVNTYLSPDTSIVRGLFIEMFLTTLLVTTVLMLATDRHTRRDTSGLSAGGHGRDGRDGFVGGPGYRHDAINAPRRDNVTAPIGIGLALFVANMAGVYYTGASLNPARSFGPSVAGTDFPGYHWIYWLGPLLGSLLAAAYYRFVRMFHEEEGYAAPDYGAAGHGHGVAGGHASHDVESGHAGYDGVSVPDAGHTSTTTAPGHMAHTTTANTAARV